MGVSHRAGEAGGSNTNIHFLAHGMGQSATGAAAHRDDALATTTPSAARGRHGGLSRDHDAHPKRLIKQDTVVVTGGFDIYGEARGAVAAARR